MAVLIPEIKIYKILQTILQFVRDDFKKSTNESESLLYSFFGLDDDGGELRLDTFKWFAQSKKVFLSSDTEMRKIGVNIGYNMEKAKFPNIHIILPQETPMPSGIGSNEGYLESDVAGDKKYPVYTQSCSTTFNLLITSDNSLEVVMIYTFLKHCLLSQTHVLEFAGFQNCGFGGSDMMFDDNLVPANIFHRNFNLNFTYDYSSRDFIGQKMLDMNMQLMGTMTKLGVCSKS